MKTCEYPAIQENLRPVLALLSEEMIACGTQTTVRQKIFIILEELFFNAVEHAYANAPAPGPVRVTLVADMDAADLVVEDRGTPFNPLEVDDTDRLKNLETLTEGHAGIFLVKTLATSLDYSYENGWNRIRVLVSD